MNEKMITFNFRFCYENDKAIKVVNPITNKEYYIAKKVIDTYVDNLFRRGDIVPITIPFCVAKQKHLV